MVWSTVATARTQASAEQVWTLWADVAGWSAWDREVEWARLDGAFEPGTRGTLKPRGGPVMHFTLTAVRPRQAFTDRASLPLATLDFIHTLRVEDGATVIEHRVEMRGPLTFLFKRLIGAGIARHLPTTVDRLARVAEGSPA